jgi:hypothetical protein
MVYPAFPMSLQSETTKTKTLSIQHEHTSSLEYQESMLRADAHIVRRKDPKYSAFLVELADNIRKDLNKKKK